MADFSNSNHLPTSKNTFQSDRPDVDEVQQRSTANERVTRTMVLFTLFIGISGWIGQFDLGYGGTVLQMETFQSAFGKCTQTTDPATGNSITTCHLSATQQSLISLTSLFSAVGGILAGFTSNYLGRRHSLQIGALLVAIGAAGMLGTSSNFLNYMVCKCIGEVGIGFILATALVYGAECTPPQWRGLLLSAFTIGLATGNLGAAGVCAGSAHLNSNWAWKMPIVCQIPLSLLLGAGVAFFPESPRWLAQTGKEDRARTALARFQACDRNSETVALHLLEIRSYIEFEASVAAGTSYLEIFRRKNIRRTLISVFIMVGTVICGLQFVAPYTAIFIGGLGIANPFLITVIVSTCFSAGSIFGGLVIEFGGRRFAMLVGYTVMAIAMLVFSAVSTALGAHSKVVERVLIACLCIWGFTFSSCIAPSGWIASTEMHTLRLRAYGQAFTINVNSIFGFAAQFWTPYMISPDYGNMGTNVGYFYFGLTLIILVVVIIFVPETARLKLEQIDDYFETKTPAWKTSTKQNKAVARANVLNHVDRSITAQQDSLKVSEVEQVEVRE